MLFLFLVVRFVGLGFVLVLVSLVVLSVWWWIMLMQVRYPIVSRSVSWWSCPWSRFVFSLASLTETMNSSASVRVSCFPVRV